MGNKNIILQELFQICKQEKKFIFDNELVKKMCEKHNFGNPFDVTKLDNTDKFPEIMIENDYFIIHLGEGKHQFIKGIKRGFHTFENIQNKDIIEWQYKKSLLNEYDTSESNILSVGFNQLIIQDFLYNDIRANPNIYNAKRTKTDLYYKIGKTSIKATNIQMEIDLTMELNGTVTIFESKNGFSNNFAIYQLFLPFLYYQKLKKENKIAIKDITCCYLPRKKEILLSEYTIIPFRIKMI